MIGRIVTIVFCVLYLGFGFYISIRHKPKVNRFFEIITAIYVGFAYVFSFIEAISNSNINNFYVQALLPTHNYEAFVLLAFIIGVCLPKCKVKDYCLSFVGFMSFALIFSSVMTFIEYSSMENYMERMFLMITANLTIVIYCFNLFVRKELKLNWISLLISLGTLLVLYGTMLLINYCSGSNFFGMSFADKGYLFSECIPLKESGQSIGFNILLAFGSLLVNFGLLYLTDKCFLRKF